MTTQCDGEPCFWIVWNPHSETPPKVRFTTRKAAQYAARSMAETHAYEGAFFYVMKMQSCHQMQGGMVDFITAPWGIGAPCPLHGIPLPPAEGASPEKTEASQS